MQASAFLRARLLPPRQEGEVGLPPEPPFEMPEFDAAHDDTGLLKSRRPPWAARWPVETGGERAWGGKDD